VPGYRDDAPPSAREATGANASLAGTPQCRAVRFNLRVMEPGRLPPKSNAGGAPRGRGAARAFRRAPGVRVVPERVSPEKRAAGRIWAMSPTIFSLAGRRPGTDGSRGVICRLVKEVGGLWSLGHFGPKPVPGGNKSAGPPAAQRHLGPFLQPVKPGRLTSC
jgi:hypothetical protein